MKILLSACVVLMCGTNVAVSQGQPIIQVQNGIVEIDGLPLSDSFSTSRLSNDEWHSIVSVFTKDAFIKKVDQPIAGRYEWKGAKIFFKPAYDFAQGETYHVVFRPAKFFMHVGIERDFSWKEFATSFSVPAVVHRSTTIESIFPESATLPENLLRMHIYFSAPMMPGNAYEHITLLGEDGTKVEKAFLVVDQELWNADRRRFTLLFDPGRIKRELKSNLDLGMALAEGGKYTLVIDSAWRDIHGNALFKPVSKTFFVSSAVRSKVSPKNWKIETPLAGSLENIIISFDRPMDHALAIKHITVRNALGEVKGSVKILNDSIWKFRPDDPWIKGEYVLMVSPLLEDVAGNNLNNSFDLDLSKESRVKSDEVIELPLTIRGVEP